MINNNDEVHFFQHNGFRLAYRDEGSGAPILLIHGFASSSLINWVSSGWFQALKQEGYRVIAIDNRGHGASDKSYDPKHYTPQVMADDACALLNYLGISKAHVMGYSMGARITAVMAMRYPEKVNSIIFGGLGIGMVTGAGDWQPVVDALLADDVASINNSRGLMFRKFADHTKSDRKALAACVVTSKQELTAEELHTIQQPTLVAVGTKDEIAGEPQPLAALLPHGESLVIPDRDHMLAVGDKVYKHGVVQFLGRHPIA